MAQYGLDYGQKLEAAGRFSLDIPSLKRFLTGPDRPTALFCLGDNAAMKVYQVTQELGIRIPDDLTVVGCDDIREAPRLHPGLTTFHTPLVEMGKTGVKRLMEKLEEAKTGEVTHYRTTLPGSIVQRNSHRAIK
jgi:LacI family transcriptional regulator